MKSKNNRSIIQELNMKSRDDVVKFLKSLWNETPMPCPLCNGELVFLHKKAKKSNGDWKCEECGHIYRTINILIELTET